MKVRIIKQANGKFAVQAMHCENGGYYWETLRTDGIFGGLFSREIEYDTQEIAEAQITKATTPGYEVVKEITIP